jgi:hypothetical protein
VICKIDNKRTNIFFFDVFYVSKCFLNLINFDQLNEIRCLMSYKSNLFMIENQNIITKKRVNNVFFFELWKHVNYNFIITFIVDDLIETFVKTLVEMFVESLVNDLSINKEILNIWHARLKHSRKQNVRRFVKMTNEMNLSSSSRTKIRASHASWSNKKSNRTTISWSLINILWIWCKAILFNFSYFTTKLNTSWFFYATLLNDQWFMCFVSNQTHLMFLNIFNNIMNMKTIEYDVFARLEKKNISVTNLTIIALNTTLNEN